MKGVAFAQQTDQGSLALFCCGMDFAQEARCPIIGIMKEMKEPPVSEKDKPLWFAGDARQWRLARDGTLAWWALDQENGKNLLLGLSFFAGLCGDFALSMAGAGLGGPVLGFVMLGVGLWVGRKALMASFRTLNAAKWALAEELEKQGKKDGKLAADEACIAVSAGEGASAREQFASTRRLAPSIEGIVAEKLSRSVASRDEPGKFDRMCLAAAAKMGILMGKSIRLPQHCAKEEQRLLWGRLYAPLEASLREKGQIAEAAGAGQPGGAGRSGKPAL